MPKRIKMFNFKNKYPRKMIEFYPANKDAALHVDPPAPACTAMPSWFTSIPRYCGEENSPRLIQSSGESNMTARHCLPLNDSFTTGYVFKLRSDVQFDRGRYGLQVGIPHQIAGIRPPVTMRDAEHDKAIKTPWKNIEGYDPLELGWVTSWAIRTPKGWSCLLIHPINRVDLPFYTIGGIVDTDRWGEPGNQPFLLKKGFEGVISEGTPIIQIIPFKRDKWSSRILKDLVDEGDINTMKLKRHIGGYYKNNAWSRKSFR